MKTTSKRKARGLRALIAFALSLGYVLGLRPRMIRWGATDEEVERPYPGAEIIPGGKRSATNAVTIGAPPSLVWPWLAQMGIDRGGWYSWDRLDNFGHRSADRIHPEWQGIAVGDRFMANPEASEWWQVAALDPERFLCLRMTIDARGRSFNPAGGRPRFYSDSTWCYLLEELPGDRTRVIESGYWALRPRWLQPIADFFLLEPTHWIMQTRQFRNLKRLAESEASSAPAQAAPAGEKGAEAA